MKKVAKLLLLDAQGNYLLMYRNNHPRFGNDVDLPGGTLEGDESTPETILREVKEETGLALNGDAITELYSSADYSKRGTRYSLFISKLTNQPSIHISWEHSAYEWLSPEHFLQKITDSQDTYMQMVHDVVKERYEANNDFIRLAMKRVAKPGLKR